MHELRKPQASRALREPAQEQAHSQGHGAVDEVQVQDAKERCGARDAGRAIPSAPPRGKAFVLLVHPPGFLSPTLIISAHTDPI